MLGHRGKGVEAMYGVTITELINKMNLKNIHEQLPAKQFLRINKSYIVNTSRIDSFDTNDIFIKSYEIGIGGGNYKKTFFEEFVAKNLQKD